LREFLEAREEQNLPEPIEGFLRDSPKRANALKNMGLAQIIECESAKIADEIAENPHTKKFCQRIGKKSLAVFETDEKKFREIVRKIGYGIKIN
jgi:predicted outer membrane protein